MRTLEPILITAHTGLETTLPMTLPPILALLCHQ